MGVTESVGIVGAGSVGQALARLLAPSFTVLISSRSRSAAAAAFAGPGARACSLNELAAGSDCIVVAVSDRSVPDVAARLAAMRARVVLHTCGSLGPSDLSPLPESGASCALFHPLQTFPSPEAGLRALRGSAFGVCGGGDAAAWCQRLASVLGGTALPVPEGGLPLYHAAAVMASNCAVGLVEASLSLMEEAGVSRASARGPLRSLMASSLDNAHTMGAERALTGPVARGDAATVRRHLEAMRDQSGPLRDLYRAFGQLLLPVASRRGLAEEDLSDLRRCLGGSS